MIMRIVLALLTFTSALFFFTGCTVALPFKKSTLFNPSDTSNAVAVVGLTHVTLGDDAEKNSLFWKNTFAVLDDLPNRPGYLGHGVRVKIFGGEAWTMTVWADQESLKAFVRSEKHQTAMQQGIAALKNARFAQFEMKLPEVPMSWKQAEEVLAKSGRDLRPK